VCVHAIFLQLADMQAFGFLIDDVSSMHCNQKFIHINTSLRCQLWSQLLYIENFEWFSSSVGRPLSLWS